MLSEVERNPGAQQRSKLAELLIIFRNRRGLSQPALAELTVDPDTGKPRVSASMIGAVEAGSRNISLEKLAALASALELGDGDRQTLFGAAGDGKSTMSTADWIRSLEDRLADVERRLDELTRRGDATERQ